MSHDPSASAAVRSRAVGVPSRPMLEDGAAAHLLPPGPAAARDARRWWSALLRPIRVPISLAVSLVALTCLLAISALVDRRTERMRQLPVAAGWDWHPPHTLELGVDEGSFLHITDVHTEPYYDATSPNPLMKACRSYEPTDCSSALSMAQYGAIPKVVEFKFGRLMCDGPWLLLKTALEAAKLVRREPDFIVITGDFPAHHLLCRRTELDVIANVTATVAAVFPNALVVPTVGNNDFFPDYNMTVAPDGEVHDQLEELYSLWRPAGWLPAGSERTFARGGFYNVTSPRSSRLRLLALNSLLWSIKRRHGSPAVEAGCPDQAGSGGGGPDPAGQFAWLRAQLEDAHSLGQRAYLFGHIPPGSQKGVAPNYCAYYLDELVSLVSQHRETVGAMIFGHHHMDQFRVMWDESNASAPAPYSAVLIAPPVTSSGRNNPAFRYMVYNRESGGLLDWVGYLLSLQRANYHGFSAADAPRLAWRQFYRLREAFGSADASPASLAGIYQKMIHSEALMSTYIDHAYGHYLGEEDYVGYLCDIRYVHYPTNSECKRLGREVPVQDHAPGSEPVLRDRPGASGADSADDSNAGGAGVPSAPGGGLEDGWGGGASSSDDGAGSDYDATA